MPCPTSHSARSTAAEVGVSAAACMRSVSKRRRLHQPGEGGQGQLDLVDGVEQRLLVLLEVAVVREGQPLERGQEAGEVADQPAGLAPGQLGHVGVLLLRQHRAAGRVGVGEPHEPELLARPQHDLLAHAAQVDAEQGEGEQRLGHEVAVADGVEGVLEAASRTRGRRPSPSGSRGNDDPARAPAPSGETSSAPPGVEDPVDIARRGPSRGPGDGGPAVPAGLAEGGCNPGGRRRPPPRPGSSRTRCSASTWPAVVSSSRLTNSRRAVAT